MKSFIHCNLRLLYLLFLLLPFTKKNEPREHKIADNDKAIFFIFLCVNSEPPLQSSQKIAEIGSIF